MDTVLIKGLGSEMRNTWLDTLNTGWSWTNGLVLVFWNSIQAKDYKHKLDEEVSRWTTNLIWTKNTSSKSHVQEKAFIDHWWCWNLGNQSDLDFDTYAQAHLFSAKYSDVDACLDIRNNDNADTQCRQLLPEHSPLKSSTRACVIQKRLTPDYPKLISFMIKDTCHSFQVTFIVNMYTEASTS